MCSVPFILTKLNAFNPSCTYLGTGFSELLLAQIFRVLRFFRYKSTLAFRLLFYLINFMKRQINLENFESFLMLDAHYKQRPEVFSSNEFRFFGF
jgi:hypothetical protein